MERPLTQMNWAAVDGAVDQGLERALGVLAELVAEQTTLGNEAGAQRIVRRELERLAFAVEEIAIDEALLAQDPASGIPLIGYQGRPVLIGRRAGSAPRPPLVH